MSTYDIIRFHFLNTAIVEFRVANVREKGNYKVHVRRKTILNLRSKLQNVLIVCLSPAMTAPARRTNYLSACVNSMKRTREIS